jgi:hypothetical protein
MQDLWSKMLAILKAPLVGELDTTHLFLLTGLILVFIAAWIMILGHIRAAASEAI